MPHDDLRADERERALISHVARSNAREAHAEAVAAKLVEVICDDEHWRREDSFREIKRLIAQRDAARAEVAALRASHRAALRDIAALEKAWETGIKAVEYRVLADLRASVKAKRDEVKALRDRSEGMDLVLRSQEVDTLGEVLALLDEVQP